MKKIAIVYHSGYGHTKKVAESVVEGAQGVSGATVTLFSAEEASKQLDALDSYDAIVFGTPTYMGSMSAGFRAFAEASSKKWFVGAWKNKIAGGFTNSGSLSGDKLNTLFGLMVFAAQHGMIWVGLDTPAPSHKSGHGGKPEELNRVGSWVGLMTQSDQAAPGEAPSPGDFATAKLYGKRIAEVTCSFNVKG